MMMIKMMAMTRVSDLGLGCVRFVALGLGRVSRVCDFGLGLLRGRNFGLRYVRLRI